MKHMLDLFTGLGGASQAFKKNKEWTVTTVDINPKFNPDLVIDISRLTPEHLPGPYDFIWASPPCESFSVASISKHWKYMFVPRTKQAVNHIKLVFHTLWFINKLNPPYWIIENPRGMLRTFLGKPQYYITQCQYGETRMKPTDLWGKLPKKFTPRSYQNKDSCHEPAPRGARAGTQGQNSPEIRAKIPLGLSQEIMQILSEPQKAQTTTDTHPTQENAKT